MPSRYSLTAGAMDKKRSHYPLCYVLTDHKYFCLSEAELGIYWYLWEKLFENLQDSLKLFVFWDWSKSGFYQLTIRGHCDSSSCIVWKKFCSGGYFLFQWRFCGHPEKYNQYEEFESCSGNRYNTVYELIRRLPFLLTGKSKF